MFSTSITFLILNRIDKFVDVRMLYMDLFCWNFIRAWWLVPF